MNSAFSTVVPQLAPRFALTCSGSISSSLTSLQCDLYGVPAPKSADTDEAQSSSAALSDHTMHAIPETPRRFHREKEEKRD